MKQLNDRLTHEIKGWPLGKMLAHKQEFADWYESEASYIKGLVHRATRLPLKSDMRTLQIGAGPCDVIDHWHDGEKHAIDPLAEKYKAIFHDFQDPSVKYIAGCGEDLPYDDNYFDVVIIRNAFDHLDDPYKALREIFRVLKPTGALYIWIYFWSWRASITYRLINALTKRYKTEPWAFNMKRLKKALSAASFIPCLPAVEETPTALRKPDNLTHWAKNILKKLLDFKHDRGFTCVCLPRKGVHAEWKFIRL